MPKKTEIAIFGGGCFWCTEAVFQELKGVVSVTPGYAGGSTANPTYEEVSSGRTGHVEVSRVIFNPEEISYNNLLTVFFAIHDPTTPNQQGADIGPQYRSVIFYTNDRQKSSAEEFIKHLNQSEPEGAKIVTKVEPLTKFYPAEDYHRQYYINHPEQAYCQIVINPKLQKLHEKFSQLLKGN